MARWLAEVHVLPRPGIADPEGQTIGSALRSLGYAGVCDVRSGKLLRIDLEADDEAAADAAVSDMCRRLLANPVMEVATWHVRARPNGGADVADRGNRVSAHEAADSAARATSRTP